MVRDPAILFSNVQTADTGKKTVSVLAQFFFADIKSQLLVYTRVLYHKRLNGKQPLTP